MSIEENVEGIGGWLVLVALGVVFSPIRIVLELFSIYSGLFSDGTWEFLTTPSTELYHPLWAPIILGELFINGALVLAWIVAIFLFFSKKRIFPKWYIGILLFTLVFIILDAFAIKVVLPSELAFDDETAKELVRSIIASLIWIPYMLVSKRVKATFIK